MREQPDLTGWPDPQVVTPLAGRGEPLLYLDFDGVLHHENVLLGPEHGARLDAPGHSLFEHVPVLEELLRPWPEIKVVLATTWTRQYGFSGAADMLGPALRARCIGSTWHSGIGDTETSFARLPRGLQVILDVQRRQPGAWVAIDDDLDDWPLAALEHLVRSDPVLGISAPVVLDQLRAKLQAMMDGRLQQKPASAAGAPPNV